MCCHWQVASTVVQSDNQEAKIEAVNTDKFASSLRESAGVQIGQKDFKDISVIEHHRRQSSANQAQAYGAGNHAAVVSWTSRQLGLTACFVLTAGGYQQQSYIKNNIYGGGEYQQWSSSSHAASRQQFSQQSRSTAMQQQQQQSAWSTQAHQQQQVIIKIHETFPFLLCIEVVLVNSFINACTFVLFLTLLLSSCQMATAITFTYGGLTCMLLTTTE